MSPFPTIRDLEEISDSLFGRIYPPGEDSEDALLDAVKEAKQRIYIVAGQLKPTFYSGKNFIDVLTEAYSNQPSIDVNIIAHLNVPSLGKALESLGKDNGPLVELVQQIPNAKMYWASAYPLYHFADADKFLLQEEKHESGQPRKVRTIDDDEIATEKYITHFENMVENVRVHPIDLNEVPR